MTKRRKEQTREPIKRQYGIEVTRSQHRENTRKKTSKNLFDGVGESKEKRGEGVRIQGTGGCLCLSNNV
jgi:hypothetical protein